MQPKQKAIAALLAVGAPVAEVAQRLGVSVSYINVLLKGDLFQYEIDEQRRQLIGERVEEYAKLLSEELPKNLAVLVEIRDNPETPASARLRAIEQINDAIVPKARPKGGEATAQVKVVLAPEQAAAFETAKVEDAQRIDNDSER